MAVGSVSLITSAGGTEGLGLRPSSASSDSPSRGRNAVRYTSFAIWSEKASPAAVMAMPPIEWPTTTGLPGIEPSASPMRWT